MRRLTLAVVCYLSLMTGAAWGQTNGAQASAIKPIHVPAGTILTFYLQTRLNPANGNAIDLLPKGTELNIKIMDSIDSDLTRDGAEFRGLVVSPVVSKDEVIIHAEAEVRGLFALLRSRSHPDGFRYELLITGITDGGKIFQLTASLNPSFLDSPQEAAKSSGGSNSGEADKSSSPNPSHKS